jgi:hypothetical protein
VSDASGTASSHAGKAAPEASVVTGGDALGGLLGSDAVGIAAAEDGGGVAGLGCDDGEAIEVGPHADTAMTNAITATVQFLCTRTTSWTPTLGEPGRSRRREYAPSPAQLCLGDI